MKFHSKVILGAIGLLLMATAASADSFSDSVLGNDGTVYRVQVGASGDLLPDHTVDDRGQSVVVLDVMRPDQVVERQVVPATNGAEVERSARILYSKETGHLNIVWESHAAGEVSVLMVRFDGSDWAAVDEIFFDPTGSRPTIAVTADSFHADMEDGTSINADRQVLHLVWSQKDQSSFQLAYSPVIVLNGMYVGSQETLILPHLNPNANLVGDMTLPGVFQVTVADSDFDRVNLTFASSETRLATTYEIDITPMEVVHFGDLIRDYVLNSEGFDPRNIANFADMLGVHIVDVGHRRQFRSRSVLPPSVLEYIATGSSNFVRERGASYSGNQLGRLADDLKQKVLELSSALYAPAVSPTAFSRSKSGGFLGSSVVIDAGETLGDEPNPAPIHVLELRFAVEIPLPDSGGSEIDLLTSEDGRRFLAAWVDGEDGSSLRYVESSYDGTWSSPRVLRLNESLNLDQALSLLEQRVR